MKVSATEYQQNVGYYFGLAEEGKIIYIEKLKPKGIKFELKLMKKIKLKKKKITLADKARKFMHKGITENGLELQDRVRS